jgi:hypothetical protein
MASTTTSEPPTELYVWCWLPGSEDPVVAGRVWRAGPNVNFNYGAGYLARNDAIPLCLPELPLQPGPLTPSPLDAAYGDELDPLLYLSHSGSDPDATLRELFGRITFNILVSNTDDHPRNHAAFWDGSMLALTPAYDISPQRRSGEASQLMAISHDRRRESRLSVCLDAAATYHLSKAEAQEIIDHQVAIIKADRKEVCDAAEVTEVE